MPTVCDGGLLAVPTHLTPILGRIRPPSVVFATGMPADVILASAVVDIENP